MSAITSLFKAPPVSAPSAPTIIAPTAPLAAPRTGGDTAARALAKRRAAARRSGGVNNLVIAPLGRKGTRVAGETQTSRTLG